MGRISLGHRLLQKEVSRLMTNNLYDLVMRLPLVGWVLLCVIVQLYGLTHLSTQSMDFVYLVHIAMRLSTMTFMMLIAAAVIIRTRPSGKASGLEPRMSALVGTFLIYAITAFPRRDLALSSEIVSTSLTMIGSLGAIVALFQLGRSFSIMAETRQLVTTGPYRFVRHPLYLAEQIATIGVFIQFASLWSALLLAVQIAFQLRRMHNEELVLTASFPEYAAYRRNTARLIPRVY
jgi:protein-S-isoprenylcysteine O-methyltransferase Ste14